MGSKSVRLPEIATPDPLEIIEKEVETNRFDLVNPYGSTRWTKDPASGRFTQTVELDPQVEAIRQAQLQRAAQGTIKNPFDHLARTSPQLAGILTGVAQRVGNRYGGGGSAPGQGGIKPQSPGVGVNLPPPNQIAQGPAGFGGPSQGIVNVGQRGLQVGGPHPFNREK